MSIAEFQRALCDLIASPDLCLAVRNDPAAALASYALSAREHGRLAAVVWQRGMSMNCTLYRSNRITPIYTLLPYTCRILGDRLGELADRYWAAVEFRDGQFGSEVDRFARFLRTRLETGEIGPAWLADVLDFEQASIALEYGTSVSGVERLCFRHDPVALLGPLAEGDVPEADPPKGAFSFSLARREGKIVVLFD